MTKKMGKGRLCRLCTKFSWKEDIYHLGKCDLK